MLFLGIFFAQVLADGLSQVSEWQQVSLGLLNSSQYSGRFQLRYSLENFRSSFDFQLFQAFGNQCSTVFSVLWQGPSTFRFLWFLLCTQQRRQDYYYFTPLKVFHASVCRWFFTGVWVSVSLLMSPGLFSVFWLILTMPQFGWSPLILFISKSYDPCTNPWVIVPRAPITTGITVTFMFHNFFLFSSKVQVFIFLFDFFRFYSVISRKGKVHYSAGPLFFVLLTIISSGCLAEIIIIYLKIDYCLKGLKTNNWMLIINID